MCVDQGAYNWGLALESEFKNKILFISGAFHEQHNILKKLLVIVFAHGAEEFANIHGFNSPSSVEYLKSCGDSHKSYDFLMRILRPAMINVLLDAYIKEKGSNIFDSENISQQDATAFIDWCKDDKGDVTFQSMVHFWVLNTIPAFALLRIGERTNDAFVYDAGRRYLLPFIITNNMNKYTKIIMSELRRFQYEAPNEIQYFRRALFSNQGQGWDAKIEEDNKSFKSYLTRGTESQYQTAAISREVEPYIRQIVHEELKMTDHTAKARSEFSYDPEKLLIRQYMSNSNYASKDSSRNRMQTYNGEYDVLTEESNSASMIKDGIQKVHDYAEKWTDYNKVPPPIPDPVKLLVVQEDEDD